MTVRDSNGAELFDGDSVQLTRDLKVKGKGALNFKKGKAFKNISVDEDNEDHVEVREGKAKIFIKTEFLKKK